MRWNIAGPLNNTFHAFALALLLSAAVASAQEAPAVSPDTQADNSSAHRWRRVTEPPPPEPAPSPEAAPSPSTEPAPYPEAAPADQGPVDRASLPGRPPLDAYGQPRGSAPQGPAQDEPGPPPPPVPDQLTIKPGTYLTVRVDQPLSSDHNQPGDAFTATLVKPLVVDGVVVMQRGQTIAGRVAEAQKAGRVQGMSRLGVQLTELTLVDGQQLPVHTQLISRTGSTSVGRDAGAVATTTAAGAAIGAAADWGTGAAIGAGAGAVAGIVGVLLTRGHETMIVPEMMLTFRVEAPLTVVTTRAPLAFRYVEPADYAQASLASRPAPRLMRQPPYYYGPSYYYGGYYGGYSPWYWGPGYWGPGVGVYFGRGFYGGGRGYYRGHRH